MRTLFIDFETYHSTKEKYDLKNISIVEYIKDPRFKIQGCAIRLDHEPTQWLKADEVVQVLTEFVDWSNTRCVAHNAKFDGAILLWRLGVHPAQWIDTKAIAKAVLGASIPSASLKDVAAALGLPAKGELKTNGLKELTEEQEKELAEYCIRDVDLCHDIFTTLVKYVPGKQWQLIDWTVRTFLEPQLKIDGTKCLGIHDEIVTAKNKLLRQVGVEKSVLSSNQQFAKLLETEGFPVPYKTNKKGKKIPALSVQDEGFLAMEHSSVRRLKDLFAARVAVKQTLEETRAKKLADISKVSDYCFDIIFSGARQTHRFSGGDGCAGNPQNFRRGSELRGAITAKPGERLIVADLKNIELRVLAFMSQDPELMKAILHKEDVYSKFASKIYQKEITKQDKKERMVGKAAVLGLGYGMGADKFRRTVYAQIGEIIEDEFAQEIVRLYRDTYKNVPRFWRLCEKALEQIVKPMPGYLPQVAFLQLKQNGIILPSELVIKYDNLGFKWKRMFNRWQKEWTYERYKTAKKTKDSVKIYGGMITENLCQGIAGDVCKEAILRLIEYGYPPAGQVHDELLVTCKEDEVEKVKYLVTSAMTAPMPWWSKLPLEVEISDGQNWLEAK